MANTIHANKIREALGKAVRVGIIEQPIILGDCPVVMQNLRPEEFESILQEIHELEDAEYYHAYQVGHLSRSIVELDGFDLRDIDFIEDDVPEGTYEISGFIASAKAAEEFASELRKLGGTATVVPPDGSEGTRHIKLERHEWVRKNVIATWSRESILVGWRKFAELLIDADAKSKEGIEFKIPDESAEDRYRRLVSELKETEEELPPDMVTHILEEAGYLKGTSPEELAAVQERAREFAREQQEKATATPPQAPQAEQEAPAAPPEVSRAAAEDAMRRRQPMNQQAASVPQPPVAPTPQPTPARRAAAVPPQIRSSAVNPAEMGGAARRAAQLAELEAQVDPGLVEAIQQQQQQQLPEKPPTEVVEVRPNVVDPKGIVAITEKPPKAGLNPRFRDPRDPRNHRT